MLGRMNISGDYEMSQEEAKELLEFVFEHVFGYGYSKKECAALSELPSLEGFAEYLNQVQSKVRAGVVGKHILLTNRNVLPRSVRRLFGRYGGIIGGL
jgi:hypothetical protein